MKSTGTPLVGVFILDVEPIADKRGFFARILDRAHLASLGVTVEVEQVSIAYNELAGTMRGLHFQVGADAEIKVVRCTAGAVFDVAVDLRDGSPTRFQWVSAELSAANHRSLLIPKGCAHGYISLVDSSEVEYQISVPYNPETARGIRWDDPTIAIEWPTDVRQISEQDGRLPWVENAPFL